MQTQSSSDSDLDDALMQELENELREEVDQDQD